MPTSNVDSSSSSAAQSGLDKSMLAALAMLPAQSLSASDSGYESRERRAHGKEKKHKRASKHAAVSDDTDSDSDGPSVRRSSKQSASSVPPPPPRRVHAKESKHAKKKKRKSHRHSSSSSSSSSFSSSSSSSDASDSDTEDDSDAGAYSSLARYLRENKSKSSNRRKASKRRGLARPLCRDFLKNVRADYGSRASVYAAYEGHKFKVERNANEVWTLARIIDLMIRGDVDEAMEAAVRRLVGVEMSDRTTRWDLCDAIQGITKRQSFVPDDFLADALKSVKRMKAMDSLRTGQPHDHACVCMLSSVEDRSAGRYRDT
jgi:hypothetical protein